MLELFEQHLLRGQFNPKDLKLFYKVYKYHLLLYIMLYVMLLWNFKAIFALLISCVALIILIFSENIVISSLLTVVSLVLQYFIIKEKKKNTKLRCLGLKTLSEKRKIKIVEFLFKFFTLNGKALGKEEWKKIKKYDFGLYRELLCDDSLHLCYFYSLKIAKVIKDSTLIWGYVEPCFKNNTYRAAHALIIKNNYVYDSNLKLSIKYDDYASLYNLKIYKSWNYNVYSKKFFREDERAEFRKWCINNDVLFYEYF